MSGRILSVPARRSGQTSQAPADAPARNTEGPAIIGDRATNSTSSGQMHSVRARPQSFFDRARASATNRASTPPLANCSATIRQCALAFLILDRATYRPLFFWLLPLQDYSIYLLEAQHLRHNNIVTGCSRLSRMWLVRTRNHSGDFAPENTFAITPDHQGRGPHGPPCRSGRLL